MGNKGGTVVVVAVIVELICDILGFGDQSYQFVVVAILGNKGDPTVVVVVSCKRSSIQRGGTVGYSTASPVVVVVSGHSRAWRDGSAGCYPETPIVVVVSGHAHTWCAGSDSWLFKTPVVVVVCGHARAGDEVSDEVVIVVLATK